VQPHRAKYNPAGCCRILSVLYATTWAAVALKLAVTGVTTGRCGEKSCVFRYNHATTVAVYCQCQMQPCRQLREKIAVKYATSAAVAVELKGAGATAGCSRILSVLDATPPAVARKTCSSRCDIWPLWREKLCFQV